MDEELNSTITGTRPFPKNSTPSWIVQCGVFLIATSPLLGNAVTYQTLLNRRLAQICILILGTSLTVYFILKNKPLFFSGLIKTVLKAHIFKFLYGFLGVHFVFLGIAAFRSPGLITLESLKIVFFLLGWLIFFVLAFAIKGLAPFRFPLQNIQQSKAHSNPNTTIPILLLVILSLLLFAKSWICGPTSREVYMAFGGNAIYAGLSAVIATFAVLWTTTGLLSTLSYTLFCYLLVMSTARSAYVIATILFVIFILRNFVFLRAGYKAFFKTAIAPVGIFLFLILLPFFTETRFYPYRVANTNDPTAAAHFYHEEFVLRTSRLLRILPFVKADYLNSKLTLLGVDFKLQPESTQKTITPDSVPDIILHQANAADSRNMIYSRTFQLVTKRPTGYWPRSYASQSGFTCGNSQPCQYPHNFILESAFYFGWLFGLATLLGIIHVTCCLIIDLLAPCSHLRSLLAISVFASFVVMQLSGTLIDSAIPMLLGYLWLYFCARELTQLDPIGNSQ